MLSERKLSYLIAPLNSTLSVACFAASAKIANADLLSLLSTPPPKKIRSGKTDKLPLESKPVIESSFLLTSCFSFLHCKPVATSISFIVPLKTTSITERLISIYVS